MRPILNPIEQPKHWAPLFNIVNNIIESSPIDQGSNEFMFIVKNNIIINIYETKNTFKLTKTYKYIESEYLSINHYNYLSTTTNTSNSLRTVYEIHENNKITNYEYNSSNSYKRISDFSEIVKCEDNSKIDIYIYTVNTQNIITPPQVYSTIGDLFIYNYGIVSTQEIIKYTDLHKPATIYNNEVISNNAETAIALLHKIQSYINNPDANNIVNIYHINAIPANYIDKYIYKTLYIEIYPPQSKYYKAYIQLLKYIDYFYWYKSSSLKLDYELKKDYFVNGNDTNFDVFKQKYKNVSETSFCVHIFDLMYILAFIDNKVLSTDINNNDILTLCNWLITKWTGLYSNRKMNKDYTKNISKITKIPHNITTIVINSSNNKSSDNTIVIDNNSYGPFTYVIPFNNISNRTILDIYNDKIITEFIKENTLIIWFGNYNNNASYNDKVYNINVNNINLPENQNLIKDIITYINYKNGNNPYFIASDNILNINCIDEYCNSNIGCFSLQFNENPKMESAWFKSNIGETLNASNITKDILFIGHYDDTKNNKYTNINKLKSILFNKDVYIANSFRNKTAFSTSDKSVITAINTEIDKLKSQKIQHITTLTPTVVYNINTQLAIIDNANKATSRGILEILDSISKLGRVNTFCNKS